MPKAYTSLQAALAAAKRIANRTGRQVRVTPVRRNPYDMSNAAGRHMLTATLGQAVRAAKADAKDAGRRRYVSYVSANEPRVRVPLMTFGSDGKLESINVRAVQEYGGRRRKRKENPKVKRWQRKDHPTTGGRAWGSAVAIPLRNMWGEGYNAHEAIRVIKERDGWRLDRASAVAGAWMPWEPIDEIRYKSAAAAKRAAQAWADAAEAEGTLSPRAHRRNPTGLTFSNDPGPGKDIGIYRPVRWKRKGGKVRKTRPKMRIPMADLADLHAGWQELRDEAASRRVTGRRSNPARLPRWDSRKGWIGGDTRTLYAFTDRRTGRVVVMPGPGTRFGSTAVGDFADVRPATRDEAERLWQSPLHSGWKVK